MKTEQQKNKGALIPEYFRQPEILCACVSLPKRGVIVLSDFDKIRTD